jgi:hypothetical protein
MEFLEAKLQGLKCCKFVRRAFSTPDLRNRFLISLGKFGHFRVLFPLKENNSDYDGVCIRCPLGKDDTLEMMLLKNEHAAMCNFPGTDDDILEFKTFQEVVDELLRLEASVYVPKVQASNTLDVPYRFEELHQSEEFEQQGETHQSDEDVPGQSRKITFVFFEKVN